MSYRERFLNEYSIDHLRIWATLSPFRRRTKLVKGNDTGMKVGIWFVSIIHINLSYTSFNWKPPPISSSSRPANKPLKSAAAAPPSPRIGALGVLCLRLLS
jgi:hypothetical protein